MQGRAWFQNKNSFSAQEGSGVPDPSIFCAGEGPQSGRGTICAAEFIPQKDPLRDWALEGVQSASLGLKQRKGWALGLESRVQEDLRASLGGFSKQQALGGLSSTGPDMLRSVEGGMAARAGWG